MTSDLFRRYIDIVTEADQQSQYHPLVTDIDSLGLTFQPTTKKDLTYSPVKVALNQKNLDQMPALSFGTSADSFVLQTVTDDGHETTKPVTQGDVIVSGPGKEKYNIGNQAKFDKNYPIDADEGRRKPDINSVRQVAQYTGQKPISIIASWGEQMNVLPGDYIVYEGPGKYYRVAKYLYDQTYNAIGSKTRKVAEGTKSLADYIAQSERAHNQPVTGDYFEINIKEDTLFETWVCDETEDGIVIYADHAGMKLLESHGYIGEELQESHDMEYEIDSDEDSVDVVDQGEYDQEGDMAKDDLATIVRAARRLTGMLDDDENMPEWVQAKINKAADYVDTAADYIESNKEREQGVAEGSKMARVDKSAKAPKPKNQQEYDAVEKYRKDLAQSYKSKKQQGVAEGFHSDLEMELHQLTKSPDINDAIYNALGRNDEMGRHLQDMMYDVASENRLHSDDDIEQIIAIMADRLESNYGNPDISEAKYQGREVPLGKPMKGDVKKSKVYVRGPKGNVVKVNFGQKGMRIKKNIPGRRKNFRARHNCDNPGPRHKARYWSCRAW